MDLQEEVKLSDQDRAIPSSTAHLLRLSRHPVRCQNPAGIKEATLDSDIFDIYAVEAKKIQKHWKSGKALIAQTSLLDHRSIVLFRRYLKIKGKGKVGHKIEAKYRLIKQEN